MTVTIWIQTDIEWIRYPRLMHQLSSKLNSRWFWELKLKLFSKFAVPLWWSSLNNFQKESNCKATEIEFRFYYAYQKFENIVIWWSVWCETTQQIIYLSSKLNSRWFWELSSNYLVSIALHLSWSSPNNFQKVSNCNRTEIEFAGN